MIQFNLVVFVIYVMVMQFSLYEDSRSKLVDLSYVFRVLELWERVKVLDDACAQSQAQMILAVAVCVQIICKAYTSETLDTLEWARWLVMIHMAEGDPAVVARQMQQLEIAILVKIGGKVFPSSVFVEHEEGGGACECVDQAWWSTKFRELWEFSADSSSLGYVGPFSCNVNPVVYENIKVMPLVSC
jgi:hypothetical protein